MNYTVTTSAATTSELVPYGYVADKQRQMRRLARLRRAAERRARALRGKLASARDLLTSAMIRCGQQGCEIKRLRALLRIWCPGLASQYEAADTAERET
jgi:hypothetical protein